MPKLLCVGRRSPRRHWRARWKHPGPLLIRNPTCAVQPTTSALSWVLWLGGRLRLQSAGLAASRLRWATFMPDSIDNISIQLKVNGKSYSRTIEPRKLLVELLREDLDLTGTHVGCDTTYCGACTVLMNGAAVKSCTMFAVQADGADILTVEGLEKDGQLHPIQKAFGDAYGLQCGYCTPGLMLSTFQLLSENHEPDEKGIRKAIAGNTCRCTGYMNIFKAIELAGRNMKGA